MARRVSFLRSRDLIVCILLILSSVVWNAVASAQQTKLVIFAAASLKDALDEVNAAYQRDKGQVRLEPANNKMQPIIVELMAEAPGRLEASLRALIQSAGIGRRLCTA